MDLQTDLELDGELVDLVDDWIEDLNLGDMEGPVCVNVQRKEPIMGIWIQDPHLLYLHSVDKNTGFGKGLVVPKDQVSAVKGYLMHVLSAYKIPVVQGRNEHLD